MTDTLPNEDDLLDRAIRAILEEPIPDSARQRALDRAIANPPPPAQPPRRLTGPPGSRIFIQAIAASLMVGLLIALLLPALSRARSQHSVPRHDAPQYNSDQEPATTPAASRPAGHPEPFPSREAATKSSRGRQPPEDQK
jgi:hypothetical protein